MNFMNLRFPLDSWLLVFLELTLQQYLIPFHPSLIVPWRRYIVKANETKYNNYLITLGNNWRQTIEKTVNVRYPIRTLLKYHRTEASRPVVGTLNWNVRTNCRSFSLQGLNMLLRQLCCPCRFMEQKVRTGNLCSSPVTNPAPYVVFFFSFFFFVACLEQRLWL